MILEYYILFFLVNGNRGVCFVDKLVILVSNFIIEKIKIEFSFFLLKFVIELNYIGNINEVRF